jgi:protein-L-isoaspartate(D-aspartate) O-methyltransferase
MKLSQSGGFSRILAHERILRGCGSEVKKNQAGLDGVRTFFARMMAAASDSDDPRLQQVFELIQREAFLGPGPWRVRAGGPWPINVDDTYVETPDANPVYLYQNVLVALDADRHINNGEPFLHAHWIGAVAPKPGDAICHIGAGTGYYSAILSVLALPRGTVS